MSGNDIKKHRDWIVLGGRLGNSLVRVQIKTHSAQSKLINVGITLSEPNECSVVPGKQRRQTIVETNSAMLDTRPIVSSSNSKVLSN